MAQWAPYYENMASELGRIFLSGERRESVTGAAHGTISVFSHAKVDRAGIAAVQTGEVQFGMCLVIAQAPSDLPLYVSVWEERKSEIRMLVDIMPTVDTLVHEPYRKRYIEPLGDLWDRFSHLPGIGPEEDDDLRATCSIIYTAARIPIEKEGMRLAALTPHTAYLKRYGAYLQSAAPLDDARMHKEVMRKTAALRDSIRRHVSETAQRAIGAEAAKKLVTTLI